MPRQARKKGESGIFHIMLRGINRQTIFEDVQDRVRFIETLKRFKEVSKYKIYGYCLMDNHVHLILRETEEDISTAIKRMCSSYVYWYNWKYVRCGHLFQERYKSEAVDDDDYLLTVLRYIHQNPLEAGLSKTVQDYKWSSYKAYIEEDVLTDTDFVLQIFSKNRVEAIKFFIKYTNEKNNDKCLDYEEKSRMSDKEIKDYLIGLGVHNSSELQNRGKESRNEILRNLKAIKGVTIRQLSRVTGVSKSIIERV